MKPPDDITRGPRHLDGDRRTLRDVQERLLDAGHVIGCGLQAFIDSKELFVLDAIALAG